MLDEVTPPAAPDLRCAEHPDQEALGPCERCGTFVGDVCAPGIRFCWHRFEDGPCWPPLDAGLPRDAGDSGPPSDGGASSDAPDG